MEEWKEYKISGVIDEISMGPFGSNIKVDNFIDFGVPVLNGSNLQGFKLQEESFNYVSQEKADSLGKANAHRGDVVITHRGTLGQIVYIPQDSKFEQYVISQSQFRLKLKQDLIRPDFFVYFFHTPIGQHRILMNASQVGVPALARPTTTFKEVFVPVPPLETQNAIMAILSSLDKKIEVNKRLNDNFTLSFLFLTCFVLWLLKLINDNLEQQSQALFKSWFVDFEPYKDIDFEETEIGRIPKSLLVKRVSEIPHTIETGRRPKGGVGEISSGVPSVGAEHVKGLGNYDYAKTKYITEEYAASLKTGKVNGYELLIYKDGGKPGYFIPNYSIFGEGYPFEECFLNEHVFKLDFGDKGYNAFCYFYFWTDYVMNYLNAQGGKAAIPGINRQDIENIQIFAPENELVKRFGDIVLPSIRQILFNCKESRRLAQLRDALLPRLMSGELKVNEIEMP